MACKTTGKRRSHSRLDSHLGFIPVCQAREFEKFGYRRHVRAVLAPACGHRSYLTSNRGLCYPCDLKQQTAG